MASTARVSPRLKSAVLWGLVGLLAFLVLHQAYLLLDGTFVGAGPIAGIAALVFVVSGVASYLLERQLEGPESDAPAEEPSTTHGTETASTGAEGAGGGEHADEDTAGAGPETDDDEWVWAGDVADSEP